MYRQLRISNVIRIEKHYGGAISNSCEVVLFAERARKAVGEITSGFDL